MLVIFYTHQKRLEQDESRQEMLNNLDSLHELVQKHHSALKQYSLKERPIARDNFFNVKSLFTLRDLFDNRVHLGHHIGEFLTKQAGINIFKYLEVTSSGLKLLQFPW